MLLQPFLVLCATVTGVGLLMLALRPLDPQISVKYARDYDFIDSNTSAFDVGWAVEEKPPPTAKPCATVEEMGKDFESGFVVKETLRVRSIIEKHFVLNGNYLFLICFVFVTFDDLNENKNIGC